MSDKNRTTVIITSESMDVEFSTPILEDYEVWDVLFFYELYPEFFAEAMNEARDCYHRFCEAQDKLSSH